jgi:hypothetical protein
MSCDSSTTASLHGPSCVSTLGQTLVCNNTVISRFSFGSFVCNCDGPVSLTGLDNSTLDMLELIDISSYQPTICSDTSGTDADGACDFKKLTNIYSYYDATYGVYSTSECLPLSYPPSTPETPYYFDGTPLICDNSLHTSPTNTTYICRLDKNLDAETIQPLYTSSIGSSPSVSILDCTSIHNSHEVIVDFHQALDRVQRNGVDLRPIINIVPT